MLVLERPISSTREVQIIRWYEDVFPTACAYLQKRGGTLEEAKELFQETIVVYYEKLMQDNFQPPSSEKAYMMGIFKNLWKKSLDRKVTTDSLEGIEVSEHAEPTLLASKLLVFLKSSGEKCMDLLQSFYYEKLSMKEVSERFNFRSERSATVQKYKCLEKLRTEVKQKSLCYEDFLD